MSNSQRDILLSCRPYLRAVLSAGIIGFASYVLGIWLTARGLHAESTYLDDVLLAAVTAALVLVLDFSHHRDQQRASEIVTTNAELMKQSEAVRNLALQMMNLQDEERRRIARNLHDSVGQLVAAATLHVSMIEPERGKLASAAAASLTEAGTLLQEISQEVRTVSHLLHPPLLDEVGLESALRGYLEGFAKRTEIRVQVEISPALGRLSPVQETSIFRIVQEAMTNIHRHSGSPTASVRLDKDGSKLRLEIRDEGRGLPAQLLREGNLSGAGVGLRGMRERMRELGGELEIASQQGHGTVISAILPRA